MKFSSEWLRDTMGDKDVDVLDRITGSGRWSIYHERIIKHEGKFYKANYSRGATESQDETPYGYGDTEIECPEVFPEERTVTVYVTRS